MDDQRAPWYKKKRYTIPAGVLAAIIIIGSFSSSEEDTVDVASRTEGVSTTEAPTPTAPDTTAPPTTADRFANESVSQRNARAKAADYLEFSAFSRSGLIKQLKYEGFSEEDATYGTDSLDADWFEQAAKKAADYMEFSAFSRSGLIKQLQFEGFSLAESEHGANSVGF